MLPASRMGTGVATYVIALSIVLASLLVGRAVMLLLGRREASFLEGAVGISALVLVCTIAIRLPPEEKASLAASAVLVAGSLIFLLIRRDSILGPSVRLGLSVALLAGLLASVPFIASGQVGIPGVGLNNDMAMHLVDTEYLIDQSRPEPQAVINGYPLGPHSLLATLVTLFDTEVLPGWLGLLVAAPVLTAITSLAVLRELPAGRRILAAALVSVAYLSASVLGIAGFKELLAGMFLIAFAAGLREIERSDDGRVAILIGLALIAAAMVPVYSFPGLSWLGITAGLWVLAHLANARIEGGRGGAAALVRRSLPIAGPAIGVLFLVGLTQLPKAIDFAQAGAVGTVAGTDSKLRFAVSPFETLGIWPSGEWLLSTTDLSAAWIFAVIGSAGLAFGLVWWLVQRDFAFPAAVISAAATYAYVRFDPFREGEGGLYIQMKAVVVPASLVMLVVLFALLGSGGGRLKRGFAAVFVVLAAYSSFLALRDVVVAPEHRFGEQAEFHDRIAGERVLSLTSDRFADYGLRPAEVSSPAFNAEIRVPSAVTKDQRLPIDFDSVPFTVLNQFPYAVTTSAVYQSQAPPGWELADETDSYKLWQRTGETPSMSNLYEEARPGRVFRCKNPKIGAFLRGGGEPLIWPRPVIAKRLYWEQDGETDNLVPPGGEASQEITLPPGRWELSIQYLSPVAGIEVEAPGLSEHLPAGVEAAIPYRPDQGPYWIVGSVEGGGPVELTVKADELNTIQKLLGVDAPAVIGNVTAVQTEGIRTNPLAASCGLYVDHIIGGIQQRNTRPGRKSDQSQ
jgi:hypothetical protein